MKIRYISDIHLEFIKFNIDKFIENIKPSDEDVLILAGDIGYPKSSNYDKFINYINNNFKKTFIITGNHEYYTSNIKEIDDYLETYFMNFDNISFLNNKIEYYNGHYFVGCTLWTEITNPDYKINDMYNIKNFTINEYNSIHDKCCNFLNQTITNQDISNVILITHHLPLYELIDNKYKTNELDKYNQWFYSDMTEFINKNKDKLQLWAYGHTHSPSEKEINNIKFVCNPVGYPFENENINFDKYVIIE